MTVRQTKITDYYILTLTPEAVQLLHAFTCANRQLDEREIFGILHNFTYRATWNLLANAATGLIFLPDAERIAWLVTVLSI